jgi:hypothetical protein
MINDFFIYFRENQKKQRSISSVGVKEEIVVSISTDEKKTNTSKVELVRENHNLYLLKGVNSNYIDMLNSINIFSINQLRDKLKTVDEIEEISKRTGIREKLIDEWVRLGEFSRIQGIRQEHINLFEKIGVKTIHELKKCDPEELYLKLFDLKKRGIINSEIPTFGMISRWVRLSKESPDRISIVK